jgi:hypothetical protein
MTLSMAALGATDSVGVGWERRQRDGYDPFTEPLAADRNLRKPAVVETLAPGASTN